MDSWKYCLLIVLVVGCARPNPAVETGALSEGKLAAVVGQLNARLENAEGPERIRLLIRRGEGYRVMGHCQEAIRDFGAALDLTKSTDTPVLRAVATQSVGYVYFLTGEAKLAESLLRSALKQAEDLGNSTLAASCANRLGNALFGMNRREEAYLIYQNALEYAGKANDPGLLASIHRNMARTLEDDERAMARLVTARDTATKIESPYERAELLIGIAAEAQRRDLGKTGADLIADALTTALKLAEELGTVRLCSEAAGRLGAFHERQGRPDLAYEYTNKALETAQQLQSHELLLQWDWQSGRLLRAKGDRRGAIDAFRRAVHHIGLIRQDIPIRYQDGRSSFRETLAPIYIGLADMLFQESADPGDDGIRQDLLWEARDVLERIKQSELRDYFKDPCIASRSQKIEILSPGTAVLYPIIFPDRLELLADIGGKLFRKTTGVNREKLEKAVADLAGRLRARNPDFESLAREIHGWLIQPVLPLLAEHDVNTLVFVPDGVFRMLPITALWDGEQFLAERFAVVTAPGLSLLDPAPLVRGEMTSLLAGLSKPGDVIFDLPGDFLVAMRSAIPNRGVRGMPDVVASQAKTDTKASPEVAEQIREKLVLPGVNAEIERLSAQMSGTVLLNENFQLKRFEEQLDNQAFRVVHIASHGYFGGDPEDNFIMTFDKRLDMNKLEAMIRPKQLAAAPVELITLSACQTAEGDDRSPLGLAGVVLKSGARSALGSLWPVSDDAAQELLPAFYKELKDSGVSKAEALRRAQTALMKNEKFRHPFYWSPFILVGNWL